jgi:hypothetical protein
MGAEAIHTAAADVPAPELEVSPHRQRKRCNRR